LTTSKAIDPPAQLVGDETTPDGARSTQLRWVDLEQPSTG
jgi:hypothetical protein